MSVVVQQTHRAAGLDLITSSWPDMPPAETNTLRNCMRLSTEVWVGSVDGQVACSWGIIPPTLLSTTAYLWLFTNDIVDEHQFMFVRNSKIQVERLLERYEAISGYTHRDSARARRWLRWLGAEFGPSVRGVIPFVIKRR